MALVSLRSSKILKLIIFNSGQLTLRPLVSRSCPLMTKTGSMWEQLQWHISCTSEARSESLPWELTMVASKEMDPNLPTTDNQLAKSSDTAWSNSKNRVSLAPSSINLRMVLSKHLARPSLTRVRLTWIESLPRSSRKRRRPRNEQPCNRHYCEMKL